MENDTKMTSNGPKLAPETLCLIYLYECNRRARVLSEIKIKYLVFILQFSLGQLLYNLGLSVSVHQIIR